MRVIRVFKPDKFIFLCRNLSNFLLYHTNNSLTPFGFYLFNKSTSFILIKINLAQILEYIHIAQFCSQGAALNKRV